MAASQAWRGVRHAIVGTYWVPVLHWARAARVALWQQSLLVVGHSRNPDAHIYEKKQQLNKHNQFRHSDKTLNKASAPSLTSTLMYKDGLLSTHPWYETVRPATSVFSQRMKTWTQSRQKEPREAEIDTLAAPMMPSLKRFSTKPPVMMPKATAGRFSIPGLINEWGKLVDEMDQYTGMSYWCQFYDIL